MALRLPLRVGVPGLGPSTVRSGLEGVRSGFAERCSPVAPETAGAEPSFVAVSFDWSPLSPHAAKARAKTAARVRSIRVISPIVVQPPDRAALTRRGRSG